MTEQLQEEKQLDAKDIKILAYRQRVSEQEEQIADLRVECTFLNSHLQEARARLAEFEGAEESDVPQDED